jgi:hypothetical protein
MEEEQEFRNWLIRRGYTGAAQSYPRAIHIISEHYSTATGVPTDIYSISDQHRISEIAHDYGQAGRFSAFGYEQNGRFRAAIRRYAEFVSEPHHSAATSLRPDAIEEGPPESLEPTNFAYEKDLQRTLCAQVAELFPEHRIFGGTTVGVEYSIGGRRIDVLLEHEATSALLVVELKSGIADFRTFGQVSMYIGLLQAQFPDRTISGVVVAGSIDDSLRQAASTTTRVSLKVYRMSLELDDA